MLNRRIVITGTGIISPIAEGKEAFWKSIFSGTSGIKPITLFDTDSFLVKTAGEISDFDPKKYLGEKGLRTLDRSTRLLASATKLALDDAGIVVGENNNCDIGFVAGNTLGSIKSISDFDRERIVDGARFVNPAIFPNTVINSPASQVAIKFNLKGFNTTISSGFCASLDAVRYAFDFLRLGRAKIILAAAVEEFCIQTYLAFYKTGILAGLGAGTLELSCPFDRRRNGIILGEGSAVLVMEELESARSRKARIYAEVLGCGFGFDAYRVFKYPIVSKGLKRAMITAISDSGLKPQEIDYISAAANSTCEADRVESIAIKDVFNAQAEKIPVSSIKSMTGELFSASGMMQAMAGLGAIIKQKIPPNINYFEKDPECNLNIIANKARDAKVDNILIDSFGPGNNSSAVVMAKLKD